MSSFDIGDRLTITATFRDQADTLINPTAVTLTVLSPDGVPTVLVPTMSSTGVWTATFAPDMAGTWNYRWGGTGALVAAEEGTFTIRRRAVPA